MAQQTGEENLIILQFDELYMSLPENSVKSVEMAADVQSVGADERPTLGYVSHGRQKWPVLALSRYFSPLPALPIEARFCVCFGDETRSVVALACERLERIALGEESLRCPVPECMKLSANPFQYLSMYRDTLLLMADAGDLLTYLDWARTCGGGSQ